MAGNHGDEFFSDREQFLNLLKSHERQGDLRLDSAKRKAILSALSERDETAEICRDSKGDPEPDPELRDTETVPLIEEIEEYSNGKFYLTFRMLGSTERKPKSAMRFR
jgi:type I restriction enzyme M protein